MLRPFNDWWNSTGKQFFIDKATSIGQGSEAAQNGLAGAAWNDVSKTLDEGQSVGAGFLAGFKRGFDQSR